VEIEKLEQRNGSDVLIIYGQGFNQHMRVKLDDEYIPTSFQNSTGMLWCFIPQEIMDKEEVVQVSVWKNDQVKTDLFPFTIQRSSRSESEKVEIIKQSSNFNTEL